MVLYDIFYIFWYPSIFIKILWTCILQVLWSLGVYNGYMNKVFRLNLKLRNNFKFKEIIKYLNLYMCARTLCIICICIVSYIIQHTHTYIYCINKIFEKLFNSMLSWNNFMLLYIKATDFHLNNSIILSNKTILCFIFYKIETLK